MSGGNFLLPALRKLCSNALKIKDGEIQASRYTLHQILVNRFKDSFDGDNVESDEELGMANGAAGIDGKQAMEIDEDEEDAPIVVTNEEIEASQARTSESPAANRHFPTEEYPLQLRKKYPVLFAAKMEHEDILMTCARALDEKTDVSLVREAGDYLVEEVEPETDA